MNNICISVSVRNRKRRTDRQNLMAIVCAAVPPQNQYEFIISWLKDREPQRPGPITRHFIRLQFFFPPDETHLPKRFVADGCRLIYAQYTKFSFVFLWPPSLCFLCFFLFCCYFSITELYIEMFLSLSPSCKETRQVVYYIPLIIAQVPAKSALFLLLLSLQFSFFFG